MKNRQMQGTIILAGGTHLSSFMIHVAKQQDEWSSKQPQHQHLGANVGSSQLLQVVSHPATSCSSRCVSLITVGIRFWL